MRISTSPLRERVASLELPGTVWIGSKPVEPVRRLPLGVPVLDALLGGGFPRGRLSEIVGPLSGGGTAIVQTLLACATRRGEVAAFVDPADVLCPRSLQAAGVALDRLLWVRPPSLRSALRSAELVLRAGGFGVVVFDLLAVNSGGLPAHVWSRLAAGARQSGAVLIVLGRRPVAGGFSTLSLSLAPPRPDWRGGAWRQLDGLRTRVRLGRNRLGSEGSAECWVLRTGD